MSARGGEHGFSLVEVMLAMVLSLIVLGAALTTYIGFLKNGRETRLRADAQDVARVAMDRLSRDLRNQVSSTTPALVSLELALPNDMMFVTFDGAATGANAKGLRRVRYCLDSKAGQVPRLVLQTQTWTTAAVPAAPPPSACPAPNWPATRTLVSGVRNRSDRPLWSYDSVADPAATTVLSVETTLRVAAPDTNSSEAVLRSAVQLRNANRPPVSAFTVTPGNGSAILNAAPALDPESQPLTYSWRVGSTTIGTAARLEFPFPKGTSTVVLRVTDNGGLTSESTQSVVIL